jgi:L-ascorbate metabolism protein UlaG (beta-lactamase superfamily)
MRCFLLLLGFTAQALGAGLGSYSHLVVADSPGAAREGVRVTYLGTNGYEFQFKGHALLVDPYFSRVDLWSVAIGSHIQPNASRINDGLHRLAQADVRSSAFRRLGIRNGSPVNAELQTSPDIDVILVTHGHFDHLLDVPVVMAKTHAHLIASASSVDLARRAGASSGDAVKPGDVRRIGPWKIRVLSATHDRLFGKVPFDRAGSQTTAPQTPADWTCGEPLAFLIEVNGQRIYIDSGGTQAQLPPNEQVDLAILGVALPDSRARLSGALKRLQPRYILPSHQDDFFRPLSGGFQFAPLSDFSFVQRECAQQKRSRLILLDYFRPWTLPQAGNHKSQKPNPKQSADSVSQMKVEETATEVVLDRGSESGGTPPHSKSTSCKIRIGSMLFREALGVRAVLASLWFLDC